MKRSRLFAFHMITCLLACHPTFATLAFNWKLASVACLYVAIKINPEVGSEQEAKRRRNFRLVFVRMLVILIYLLQL
jgi:hypothetical protein